MKATQFPHSEIKINGKEYDKKESDKDNFLYVSIFYYETDMY